MNDGKLPKNFIACGKNTETALANINKHWKYGFFNADYVPDQLNCNVNKIDIEKLKKGNGPNGANILIIDNKIDTVKRVIEYLNYINNNYGYVQILCVVLIDEVESDISKELKQLHTQLEIISSSSMIHLNRCKLNMIEPLINIYNHLFCGFSIICTDFSDVYNVLNAGLNFEASIVSANNVDELPSALHQAFSNICSLKLDDLKGISLTIVANNDFTVDLFEICGNLLKDKINEDVEFVYNTNIEEDNDNFILLGATFN